MAELQHTSAEMGLHVLLTPGEQVLLQALLERAATRDEVAPAVEGFAWAVSFNPFTYLDAMTNRSAIGEEGRF